ncbi:MAG: hypothetical protein ACTSUE_20065 [Promethearchaeota archaeon]
MEKASLKDQRTLRDPWVDGGIAFSDDVTLIQSEFKDVYAGTFAEIMEWTKKGIREKEILRQARTFVHQDILGRLLTTEFGTERSTTHVVMMAAQHKRAVNTLLDVVRHLDARLNALRKTEHFPEIRRVMIEHVAIHMDVSVEGRSLMVDSAITSVISKYSAFLTNIIAQIQRVYANVASAHTKWMDRLQEEVHHQHFNITSRLIDTEDLPLHQDDIEEPWCEDIKKVSTINIFDEWLKE